MALEIPEGLENQAVALATPGELYSFISLQASVTCGPIDNQTTAIWINNLGPMYVRHGWVWIGVAGLGRGDISYWLYNQTRNMVFDFINDDHYDDRGNIEANRAKFDFRPWYMLINPGDAIAFYLGAVGPYAINNGISTPFPVGAFYCLYYTTTA